MALANTLVRTHTHAHHLLHTHAHTHTNAHTHIQADARTHAHRVLHTRAHTDECTHTHPRTRRVHKYKHATAKTPAKMHKHTQTQTNTKTSTHMYFILLSVCENVSNVVMLALETYLTSHHSPTFTDSSDSPDHFGKSCRVKTSQKTHLFHKDLYLFDVMYIYIYRFNHLYIFIDPMFLHIIDIIPVSQK